MKTQKPLVLVAGGAGYIGSHTTVSLQKSGYDVLIADDLSNAQAEVIDRITQITGIRPLFEKVDLSKADETTALFDKYPDIQSVMHFAASKAVGESVALPTKYYRNNLNITLNLIDEMIRHQIQYVVFSSSCTVYGQPEKLPVSENAPIQPAQSPYGNTKQICEEILYDTIQAGNDIKTISLRYFNPVGAHESALIGELPQGVPNNLVPFITQTAAGVRPQLKVYGNDYNTPDGSCVRDYIHVMDLAEAHVAAITRLTSKKNKQPFEVFNIGTGKGNSVLEVVHTFEKITGVKLNYQITARRAGDVEQVYADTTLANNELGWKAQRSLDDCLLSAWQWEKRYRNIK